MLCKRKEVDDHIMITALKIGDKTQDDSLVVLDEDRLCYQVLSRNKGASGIRTISKALLAEWVSAVMQHPDYSSQDLRDLLCGKTKIDKFEYGYNATLKKMADMVLGKVEVVRAKADYSAEFCRWFAESRGKGKDTTAKKYISYFKTLTDAYQEPTNSYWHGLYRVIYSADAEKDVIEIGELAEFERIYGGIVTALEEKVKGVGMTDEGFQRAIDWFWKPEVKSHTCVTSALNAYSDFLEWRETQQPEEKKPEELPPNVDRLAVALKMFAERRATDKLGGWRSYDDWTHGVRTDFVKVDDSLLADPDFDYLAYIRKYAISWQVANTQFAAHTQDEKRAVLRFLKEQMDSPKSASWYIDTANRLCVGGKQVDGMAPKAVLYFMSELHPEEFAAWSEPTYENLAYLGLHNGAIPKGVTIATYEDCKAKQQQIVARMKELGIGKASDDPSAADYRTANEFLWWLGQTDPKTKQDNKDLIKEEVMSKAMKPADYSKSTNLPTVKKPKVNLAKAEDVVLLRLAAALRTKPFAILAGHSGTGKSRMVRQLAYMTAATGNHKVLFEDSAGQPLKSPGNFCMVQVKPNWHDSTDLLGYYSELKGGFKGTDFVKFICKAYAYPDVPFFVCLDEMNLAPVEQYFAEYLSAIESRKIDDVVILDEGGAEKSVKSVITDRLLADEAWRTSVGVQDCSGLGCEFTQSEHWLKKYGLTIPRNLFVVGTVNMDESTNQFSRKVLDRAFTLEMTDADFEHFGDKNPEPTFADFAGDDFAKALLDGDVVADKPKDDAPQTDKAVFAAQIRNLTALKPVLDGTSFVVAYRFANEYMLYAAALGKMCDVMEVSGGAAAPSGETTPGEAAAKNPEAFDDMILMKVLPRITGDTEMVMRIFAGDPGRDKEPRALDDADVGGLAKLLGKESASFEKMKEIVKRGESSGSGTLTFWP